MNAPTESDTSVIADLLELDEIIVSRMEQHEIAAHARHLIRHLESNLSQLTPSDQEGVRKQIAKIRDLIH